MCATRVAYVSVLLLALLSAPTARTEGGRADPVAESASPRASGTITITGNSGFLIRKQVGEVRLLMSVSHVDGRVIEHVRPDDLKIYDNSVRIRDIAAFERVRAPLRVLVLFDRSASVRPVLPEVKARLPEFVEAVLSQPGNQVLLACFNSRVTLLTDFTASSAEIRDVLSSISVDGLTALHDALVEVSRSRLWETDKGEAVRRVLLLVSDGNDTLSMHTLNDAVAALTAADITVYALNLRYPGEDRSSRLNLQKLASETGGDAFDLKTAMDASASLTSLSRQLSSQYSIVYRRPAHDWNPGYHEIYIIPRNPAWTVRARSGYIAER